MDLSERLGVTTESWRPPPRNTGLDPQVTRLAAIAGGVAVIGVLAFGGYALLNRAPHTVPVIEADSRPLRVRPDNPGGMQIAGADEQIMGGAGAGPGDAMAPPPETPQVGALQAQIQAAKQPIVPPPPPVQPVALAVPAPAAPPAVTGPRAMAVAPPVSAPPVSARGAAAAPAGHMEVQLAAMTSEPAARAEWQRLSKRVPDLLGGRQPALQQAERDGKPIWRLRTGGFADTAEATAFCGQMRAKGLGCSIASF